MGADVVGLAGTKVGVGATLATGFCGAPNAGLGQGVRAGHTFGVLEGSS